MRLIVPALAFVLTGLPAFAQTAPAAPQPPAASKPVSRFNRKPFEQRFDAANTTKDGKLTLVQARAAKLRGVVRYFATIDVGKKGYVTKEDVAAFRKTERGKKVAL